MLVLPLEHTNMCNRESTSAATAQRHALAAPVQRLVVLLAQLAFSFYRIVNVLHATQLEFTSIVTLASTLAVLVMLLAQLVAAHPLAVYHVLQATKQPILSQQRALR